MPYKLVGSRGYKIKQEEPQAEHNQPMPRGGKREGAGRKSPDPRTKTFTTRCTPEEHAEYVALKQQHDAKRQTKRETK